MSFTESDAKEKWCPHALVLGTLMRGPDDAIIAQGSQNRGCAMGGALYNCLCVGSRCMMWRWSRAKETKAYLDAVQAHMKETGDNFNVATNKVWAQIGSTFDRVEGYCGLAGRPE